MMRTRTLPFGFMLNQPAAFRSLRGIPLSVNPASSAVTDSEKHISGFSAGRAELVDWEVAAGHVEAWAALSANALEPNVFLAPGFALPAVQHIPVSRRPSFLLVWSSSSQDERKLVGLFAMQLPRAGSGRLARMWCTPLMAMGTPLLDRREAYAAIGIMHDYLTAHHRHIEAIIYPQLSLKSPVANLLMQHASVHDLQTKLFDETSRAIVTNHGEADDFLRDFISAKKRKELRRQRRRLEDLGVLSYTSATSPADVRDAMECFFALEASGWKGGQQTALLSEASTATFARSMTRYFARQAACRIDALELNGKPIAMGIVLTARDTAFYWKTAYDESFARYSPGVHFSIEMTGKMIAAGNHQLINSCAIPNHPMIDHIWRERVDMGDLCTSTLGASPRAFTVLAAKETARRQIRSIAKTAYHAVLRR